jgi:hypothetical protein
MVLCSETIGAEEGRNSLGRLPCFPQRLLVFRGSAPNNAKDALCGRFSNGVGLCADHRKSGSVPVWQADRELSGTGAIGGVERGSATAGTYHEERQLSVAFPAGRSGASDGAQPAEPPDYVN